MRFRKGPSKQEEILKRPMKKPEGVLILQQPMQAFDSAYAPGTLPGAIIKDRTVTLSTPVLAKEQGYGHPSGKGVMGKVGM